MKAYIKAQKRPPLVQAMPRPSHEQQVRAMGMVEAGLSYSEIARLFPTFEIWLNGSGSVDDRPGSQPPSLYAPTS